jgi:hypothetical protein
MATSVSNVFVRQFEGSPRKADGKKPSKELLPKAPAPVVFLMPCSPKKRVQPQPTKSSAKPVASFKTHTILVHGQDQLKAAGMAAGERSPEVSHQRQSLWRSVSFAEEEETLAAGMAAGEASPEVSPQRQALWRSASFAEEKEALVVQTIQAVGHAVQVAKAALEIASLNMRKRQSSQAMALGAGSCAADGDSDQEDEYEESTCSFSGQSLPEDSPSDCSTAGSATAHFCFRQALKGSSEDDARTSSTCSSPLLLARTSSTCSSPLLLDMQEGAQEQYSPRSEISSLDGSAKLSQITQVSDMRRRCLAGERHLLKERKRALMKQDWNDSLLKKIEEISPNARPSLEH